MQPLFIQGVLEQIQANIVNFIDFLPTLFAAILIVLAGFAVGTFLQPIVSRTARRIELDEKVRQTPFGPLFPDEEGAVSNALGAIVKYYVLLIAIFAAAEWIELQFVTTWLESAISYLPSLVAGVVILLVGFFVADHVANTVRRSEVARESGFSAALAAGTKVFLYFVVVVIGLDTMGVPVAILYTFAQAFAFAFGLAAAIAIGIAFGWGGKDYVSENIDGWLESSKDVAGDDQADD
ncbi:mechanosensitive ion channel family protein [Natrarchaeobius chitinivorans]|uniref:Mechanosensitive ion channel family protein n=1 Tax=Natrarchaeobius chitinivorans TaxID=1679083 RepID=A0A3N6PB83_NATCH|nr:hypothetical protein [Natrarchaeobius chitinivorans]RQG96489.1 hypothetical protein EA473_05060 [Natrarchaeobius chitinivorans]